MSSWLYVTNQARDEITRNAAWWAEKHSTDEALKWYDSVYQQLDELLPFPESHGLAVENDSFPYELREKLVGGKKRTYRAIFTIVGSEIRVLTRLRPKQVLNAETPVGRSALAIQPLLHRDDTMRPHVPTDAANGSEAIAMACRGGA